MPAGEQPRYYIPTRIPPPKRNMNKSFMLISGSAWQWMSGGEVAVNDIVTHDHNIVIVTKIMYYTRLYSGIVIEILCGGTLYYYFFFIFIVIIIVIIIITVIVNELITLIACIYYSDDDMYPEKGACPGITRLDVYMYLYNYIKHVQGYMYTQYLYRYIHIYSVSQHVCTLV